ncbi:MAG: translation factor SUA5, partial [Oscillospiraceae bacterium]|nr:translation factor SUA5 [Oscillospiraceae bacterium]
ITRALQPHETAKAPGMKYRHYAPKAPVTVVTGDASATADYIAAKAQDGVGVICFTEFKDRFAQCVVRTLGASDDEAEQARRVFEALRSFDETDVRQIYAQCPDDVGLGLAVANRLKKAAGFCVIEV